MSLEAVLANLAADEPAAIRRLTEWLRIPSISTDPKYKPDVRRAAEWCAAHLRASGLRAEICDTGNPKGAGHPVVMGYFDPADGASPDTPHILFYGHYDVQPVDPLNLWESGPFEPVIREQSDAVGRRIVARGSCDDKGQVMMFLEALRSWKNAGKPGAGVRLTVMIEGEEESSSANLPGFVKEHAQRLATCDVCVISDTGMLSRTQPAITYGLRGLTYTEVTLHAADQDLHSGLWGGRAPNPNNELSKVLSQLWDHDGRVTIPGFYDAVIPLTQGERDAWKGLKFDAAGALAKIGLPPEADRGEAGFSALEREWARPTADINGIYGGYTGEGAKTVIPAHASAKVSFRLVADQNPDAIAEAFFAWCKARTPVGCRWEFKRHGSGVPVTVPTDSPYLRAAKDAIHRATGVAPVLIKSGGSIPIAGLFKSMLSLDTIFMGFGLDDDRVHSPNEKFELNCYSWGAKSHAIALHEFSKMRSARIAPRG